MILIVFGHFVARRERRGSRSVGVVGAHEWHWLLWMDDKNVIVPEFRRFIERRW